MTQQSLFPENPTALSDRSSLSVSRIWLRRTGLVIVLLAVAAGTYALTAPFTVTPDDADLGRLLRAMALIKGGIVAIAAGAVLWRFARPVGLPTLLAYGTGLAIAIAAVVFIWSLISIPVGALTFYVGLGIAIGTGWREGPKFWTRNP